MALSSMPAILGLSPRGRGKHRGRAAGRAKRRSIPAWAGETLGIDRLADFHRVYPRVGGGNAFAPANAMLAKGLSPRGRGKPGLGLALR